MLVDAAVELCITQGYESTTVEQIAAAAEISTRTFSRYFATKDACSSRSSMTSPTRSCAS